MHSFKSLELEGRPEGGQHERLRPPPRVPMMMVHDVERLFDHFVRAAHDEVNLQSGYRNLLFHLSHRDGVTQLTLARLTHLKPPTVSVTLQKMEADGYVTRHSDENDLRKTLVYLTDKGREYNERIHARVVELSGIVMDGFTEEEKKQLCSYLERMQDNLIRELKTSRSDIGDLPEPLQEQAEEFCRKKEEE